ncbi:Abc1 family protein [Thalictrum thalictroides]|uniref:Abc1 family protein n=1 Tax=Thalictrum thalictroides TaxID=46969 RepID=A0A7J6UX35_THATH|nr:Abc1 family protein [Thalictrum thalictroides]
MGWGNIYKRRVKVFTLALVIYFDYKALQQREKWASKSKKNFLWEKAHERNAKRLLNLIIELEGLWVKMGQYLSTRADVLPEAYIYFLRQLQDSLPPRPLQEIYRNIQKELGKTMDELFSTFDDNPIATASIAQVHRATLRNGQDVVVKVQHEGIKAVILEDLKNAKSIVDWIAWAEPQYDFNPMIDEWCKEAPKELDFNHEAENTRTVSKNLGCKNNHRNTNSENYVDVLIPEVIQSSEKVLILEYMDGIRLNDSELLEAFGVDKKKVVEEITRAYAHQIYVDGFFNGDPHPGNFLVSKEPPHRPILLDFGLTKLISSSMKQALAKMFLASAEGDHVALLSAFAEMGLKLRLDLPEQAMMVTNVFFRASTPSSEALENMKSLNEERTKNMKIIQEKMKLSKKEVSRFNPVDAFPGDAVIFVRVLNLLRGLSSTLNVRVVYLDIMRPFAESVLQGKISRGPVTNAQWISTPVHSDLEAKLRELLIKLGDDDKILGIQVCAYKDGKVIIDTAAGVLGRYDPRPVKPDSLFPVFSATKGITAGMLHWLIDNGKLKLDENVANIWSEFGANGKNSIKVHHVLNHTSGLHNALSSIPREDPLLMCDWDECLNRIAMSVPESEPGHEQQYHYLSFGWLCGGIIERASGKKFQEILNEAIINPLNVEGELYIGIPPGVESRLATLTVDVEDLKLLAGMGSRPDLPSTFQLGEIGDIPQMVAAIPILFNTLNIRRAIIPAANGHCSARALARYYATLVTGGIVPPPHTVSEPPLGSHPHIPTFSSLPHKKKGSKSKEVAIPKDKTKKEDHNHRHSKYSKKDTGKNYVQLATDNRSSTTSNNDAEYHTNKKDGKIFINPKIHDSFMGLREYENLVSPNGAFGLGFKRYNSKDGPLTAFGHSGLGGSTGFCDVEHNFAIAVTLNKMSLGGVTRKVMQLVCSELNIPLPEEFARFGSQGSGMQQNFDKPLIN